jgi:putative transcriptional regulator
MDSKERLIQMKEGSGMNWKEFSAYFQIPYRTVQDWERGNRKMPEYVLRLMEYKLRMEKLID